MHQERKLRGILVLGLFLTFYNRINSIVINAVTSFVHSIKLQNVPPHNGREDHGNPGQMISLPLDSCATAVSEKMLFRAYSKFGTTRKKNYFQGVCLQEADLQWFPETWD